MKNIFLKITSIMSLVVALSVFTACDDTSETLTVTNGTAPTLADITIKDINLDAVNTNTPAITLNWSKANYGQQTAINYAVQFSNDEAFTTPVTATSIIGQNAVTLSMAELNAAAGNTGLNPFEWGTLYTRIVSSLGSNDSNKVSSNTISFKVYPYYNYTFKDYYLVGSSTAPSWDNNNNNPALFRSASNENEFTYTGYFGDGQFKVLETKGLWQPQWGTNDGTLIGNTYKGTIDVNPGGGTDPNTLPNNNNDVSAGFYKFTINFASKKYTFEPYDATGATSPASLTLEGTAVASSTQLNALTFDGHIWYVNNVHLTPGNIKFVTGAGASWGGDTSFSGVATDGGANIPVIVEDDYDVWFNDLTGDYILVPLNL